MAQLPILKGRELARALNRLGFFEYHRVGSHVQFKHADGRRTTVAIHAGKDIPRGTLRAILRDIEISPKEFLKALKKK